jgi:hypothetical protein
MTILLKKNMLSSEILRRERENFGWIWIDRTLAGLLETSAFKEGARAGEWSPQPGKNQHEEHRARGKEDVESTTLGKEVTVIHR